MSPQRDGICENQAGSGWSDVWIVDGGRSSREASHGESCVLLVVPVPLWQTGGAARYEPYDGKHQVMRLPEKQREDLAQVPEQVSQVLANRHSCGEPAAG